MNRFAFDICAGIKQDKFMFLPRNDRCDATPFHAGDAAHVERGRCENASGVAQRNQGVCLAFMNQFSRR